MCARTELLAAFAAVLLASLSLGVVRAGCEAGVLQDRVHAGTTHPVRTGWAMPHAAAETNDRAGAGLETGMPYYSFAARSLHF